MIVTAACILKLSQHSFNVVDFEEALLAISGRLEAPLMNAFAEANP